MDIADILKDKKYEVKAPRKDEERRYYLDRLAEVSGWSKRGLVFSFAGLPTEWIKDAIKSCEQFTTQSTRGYKLKEFITKMKGDLTPR